MACRCKGSYPMTDHLTKTAGRLGQASNRSGRLSSQSRDVTASGLGVVARASAAMRRHRQCQATGGSLTVAISGACVSGRVVSDAFRGHPIGSERSDQETKSNRTRYDPPTAVQYFTRVDLTRRCRSRRLVQQGDAGRLHDDGVFDVFKLSGLAITLKLHVPRHRK